MKIIMGGVSQPTLDGTRVNISRSMSDPVPTCSLSIKDNNSSIFPQKMQELLVLDDQIIPNPTVNMLQNPSLNPYTTIWTTGASGPIGATQNSGGGVKFAFTSASSGNFGNIGQGGVAVRVGQNYMLSLYLQGVATPTNLEAIIQITWVDAANNGVGTPTQTTIASISTSLTRYSLSGVAPANAAYAFVLVQIQATANGVTGTIALTQLQFEPQWFPALSYPTPWCGPSQTNCQQLPSGLWIRQYRKFAGFVNHVVYDNYHGNVRTVNIDASGYAWLMSLVFVNNNYTNQADSAIFSNLLSTYFPGMFTTTNVITGITLALYQSNWDDIRTLLDGLAAQASFYWTVDNYWNAIYAPAGYFSMPINLICDNSSNPDMVTTFPAYSFSAEMDYTQPGSTALVIGSGTNVAEVIDPNTTAIAGILAGYSFKSGSMFMRKINDSTLQSVSDCTQRGMAELLQYDYERWIYHLTTNVELIPGQSVQITSNTDNLNQDTQLIQQVSASWLGVSETLTDTWEYKADLGAVNRNLSQVISRIHRITQRNTSAPAISTTTLAVIEQIGLTDSLPSRYAQTILADSPLAYYRLGEPSGTTAYDWSGNTFNGTINGTVTPGQPGAIANDPSTSMLFDGSTGYITLAAGLTTNGLGAFSVETWVKLSNNSFANYPAIVSNNIPSSTNLGFAFFVAPTTDGSSAFISLGFGATFKTLAFGTGALTAGNWYHLVGTYDGSTMRGYINGTLMNSMSASGTLGTTSNATEIARYATDSGNIPANIDECAIYNYTLSSVQITNHYKTGKGIK